MNNACNWVLCAPFVFQINFLIKMLEKKRIKEISNLARDSTCQKIFVAMLKAKNTEVKKESFNNNKFFFFNKFTIDTLDGVI